jgi:Fe2+ or Zn2+ uptake regulation protein
MLQDKKIEGALAKIRAGGGRITGVRKALVEILFAARSPLAPSDILKKLRRKKLSPNRTTIYRELIFLVERGIAQKVQFERGSYFEISSTHHHHLICRKCKSIEEVVLGPHLENQEHNIYKSRGFKVTSHSLEFYGICKNCQV